MIPLTKTAKPAVLVANEGTWTAEYVSYVSGATVPEAAKTRYRHPDVKAALRAETCGKCAYCESKIGHVAPGDVEHIAPKRVFPERVVDWSNLTLACTECNRRKGDYHEPTAPLVNPYVDDPGQHLVFLGPWVTHVPGSSSGHITRGQLALNRPDLLERRRERLEMVQALLDRHAAAPGGPLKEFLDEELQTYVAAEAEFSASTQSVCSQISPP